MVKVERRANIDQAVSSAKEQISKFLIHVFIKRNQSNAFEDSKVVANNPEVAVVQLDFSENYTAEYQDEEQSAHWRQGQISMFTVVWSADNGNESLHFCVERHGAVSTLLLPLVLEYELAS